MQRILAWLYGRPYLLLTLTVLMWGGNAVASRLAVGEVSPMTFTFLRWTLPVVILGVSLHQQLLAHRQTLAERWPLVLLMGTLGLTVFNALMYVAAHHTTAVNITILQGSMPVLNLVPIFGALLAVLILGEPFAAYHAVGLALVLGGIWLAEPKER
jgi:drug/metabolite transporter (DMT)-like permease